MCCCVLVRAQVRHFTHIIFLIVYPNKVYKAGYKGPTCLEAGLEHIRGYGHGPVEDPSHASSKQNNGNTQLIGAAEKQQLVCTCVTHSLIYNTHTLSDI